MKIDLSKFKEMIAEETQKAIGNQIKNAVAEGLNQPGYNKLYPGLGGPGPGGDSGVKPKVKLHNFDDYDLADNGGFDSLADFLKAVKDNNIQALSNCQITEKDIRSDMAPGSFLIPSKFLAEMIDFMSEESIVMPRAKQYKLSRGQGSDLTVPAYEAYDFTDEAVSGIKLYWKAEGATLTETDPKLRQVNLKLNKLTGYVDVTDETLMSSAINTGDLIGGLFGRALAWKLDREFILTGVGAGQPLACVSGNDFIAVSGESGQTASTLIASNVANMMKKLYPEAWAKAIFISSVSLIEQLMQLHFNAGVSAIPVPAFNSKTGKWNILGVDLKFSQHTNNIGSANCLMLADFSRYAVLTRDQMMIKFDPYTQATSGKNRYIMTYFVDGQSLDSDVTDLADSTNTMSSFIGISAIT